MRETGVFLLLLRHIQFGWTKALWISVMFDGTSCRWLINTLLRQVWDCADRQDAVIQIWGTKRRKNAVQIHVSLAIRGDLLPCRWLNFHHDPSVVRNFRRWNFFTCEDNKKLSFVQSEVLRLRIHYRCLCYSKLQLADLSRSTCRTPSGISETSSLKSHGSLCNPLLWHKHSPHLKGTKMKKPDFYCS